MQHLEKLAHQAKEASRKLAHCADGLKKEALLSAADALLSQEEEILKANQKDLAQVQKRKLSSALIDRLTLHSKRIGEMARGVREIAGLPDPVGEVMSQWHTKDGMQIKKVRVPLGVIAMIYEARPNVTVEAAALCIKSGNSVILRGGSEALHSNRILCSIFSSAVEKAGIPKNSVQLVQDTSRKNIYQLCRMDQWIDLMIARGSEQMVKEIQRRASVPVLGHGKGVCHVYVDEKADLSMAEEIAFNAKVQRPGVCNAMESLLVHQAIAEKFLPKLVERYKNAGVTIKGDGRACKIVKGIERATDADWSKEYLDLILSLKIVNSLEDAIEHIHRFGSGHTETIVTENKENAEKFLNEVDSAAVFHNASTRMHDGGVFGLGAEIGISTQKLHARGTMGAKELTTTKYVVLGSGQVRE